VASAHNILLMGDDTHLRHALSDLLARTGEFNVFETRTAARPRLEQAHPDLVLLDAGPPDTDARELCRTMRRQGVTCPILMLISRTCPAGPIPGIDSGASDYVTKPCKFAVLLARIRAQLRGPVQSVNAVFRFGPYRFRPARNTLETGDNRTIHLTDKESGILTCLCRAPDGVVARDVLLQKVWGYGTGIITHTLETHIHRMRRKIETDPSAPQRLVTERGGYRLVS